MEKRTLKVHNPMRASFKCLGNQTESEPGASICDDKVAE